MVTGIIQTIRRRGFRFMAGESTTGNEKSGRFDRHRGATGTTAAATGFVTALRHRGVGYIERDGEGGRAELFFDRAGVAGDGFGQLHEGQRVSFDEEPDPGGRDRPRAVNVRPVGENADPPPTPPKGAVG
jgi:cold shock CspA family protein